MWSSAVSVNKVDKKSISRQFSVLPGGFYFLTFWFYDIVNLPAAKILLVLNRIERHWHFISVYH